MTLEKRHDLRFPVFVFATVVAAIGLSALAWAWAPALSWARDLPVLLVLLAAVLLSELLTVMFPDSSASISMTYPLGVAIFVCFGAAYGAVAGLVSALPLLFGKPRMAWIKIAFNAGQMILSLVVPGLLYQSGARLLMTGPIEAAGLSSMVVPLVLAATVGVAVNSLLVPAGVTLIYRQSFRRVWVESVGWTLPSQVVLGFVGVMIAQIIALIGLGGFALFAIPLVVARQTFQQSVQLREAYSDTVTSLVAALEAKDVYTKGHSMRVAEYAVLIAGALGLDEKAIDRVRYAALLHDLGKVGVSRHVLEKDSTLTDAEYDQMKRHPQIGAHILEDVPYLADLVPSIAAHHEQLDGSGYGEGLMAEDIPLAARILSVADSYDAMTSERPYRGAMSHEAASLQLHLGTGVQFDPDVVAAFERTWTQGRAASAVSEVDEALR
jgi:putative nucleotidyltransferase with HDIG domain